MGKNRQHPTHVVVFFVCASLSLSGTGSGRAQESSTPVRQIRVGQTTDPSADASVRRQAQLATLDQFEIFWDFRFEDRQPQSGIRFVHQITDDSGKLYKPNHYDHGNGVVVADVDGDDLYDIYFVNQLGTNALYKNLGDGKFRDITATAGIALGDRVCATASFADVDNDGDADLYVSSVRFGNTLFENDGSGRFADITDRAGLAYSGHSSAAVFFDYDRDGLPDLFLANVGTYTTEERGRGGYYVGFNLLPNGLPDAFAGHLTPERTETSILYRNLGDGRFEDVSKATGLVDEGWSGDASPVDLNRDGFIDLYVLNMQGDDHYWENVDGKRFVERTKELFPRTPWGTMGVKFFDYNCDGGLDLMLTDMHSDMSQPIGREREKLKSDMQWPDEFLQGGADNIFGNAFFEQTADGKFREVSDAVGAENYWPWGISVDDLNADGWDDVFVAASMNFPFRYGVNTILLNNRGQGFLDSEYLLGVEPRRQERAFKSWFLMECDGVDKNNPRCAGRHGTFDILGALGSRSSVVFDLDDDGDLDIVTNDFNSEPMVLISDLSDRKPIHYLKVKLVGTVSNRDALGSTVTVTAGGRAMTKTVDGVSGYLSHSRLPLYFGLGEAATVESVMVHWTSGKQQTLTEGVTINSVLELTEPMD